LLIGIWIYGDTPKEPEIKTYLPNSKVTNYNNSYTDTNVSEEGYEWAENNDPTTFEECQDQFGTGDNEDECNRYVKENYTGSKTFNDYKCTEDCSGHQAGYEWADEKGIDDEDDCSGKSDSFIEGCKSYVEENS
jgi:hypothetical protein